MVGSKVTGTATGDGDMRDWGETDECPFCGTGIPDAGAGFIDHIRADENTACREQFNQWRNNIANDMAGGWPG